MSRFDRLCGYRAPVPRFLVALEGRIIYTSSLKICYDASQAICVEKEVSLFPKETHEEVLDLLSVPVAPADVTKTPPAPPLPGFGPPAVVKPSSTLRLALEFASSSAALEAGDPRLLPGVQRALEGSGTPHLPIFRQATKSFPPILQRRIDPQNVEELSPIETTSLLTLPCKARDARAESAVRVDTRRPARETPDAFPQSYEAIIFVDESQTRWAPLSDTTAWGPHYASPSGLTLPAPFARDIVVRAKELTSAPKTFLTFYTDTVSSHLGRYGIVVNGRQMARLTRGFSIERIDVDDPVVTDESTGEKYTVKGTWTLRTPSGTDLYPTEFATGTGVDVLVPKGLGEVYLMPSGEQSDGRFEVEVRFMSRTGREVQSHTVTF